MRPRMKCYQSNPESLYGEYVEQYNTSNNNNPIEREKFSIKMEEMLWKHTLRERPKSQGAPKKKKKR